ncbi:pre-peptidase C-terminal domain-containing protein [Laspinema olomoucense]|uniref:pre-peptidase C-terminal domain-containing protein n=1 Tax=Laspinema olomoucense TaxID=3231600 RepID=UPI0021BB4B68|nr:pre-peptidase C-terminal domain-containing protein [Laspinema sp. D3a]MCT7990891.1 pre-peptidase C-terminal domain-containing protein [Laspinema sp. D3a]
MFSFDTDTKEIARLLRINPDPIAPSDGDILKPFGANQLPLPGAADAIALPTLVSVACDNLVIPLDMSVDQGKTPTETDSHTATSVDSLTGIALAKSHEQLQQFANSPEFLSQMSVAFGDDFDVEAAQDLADSLTNGTFQTSPIKIVSAADINGSNGAFVAETNNIYLSSEFVADNADNLEAIVSVLLEEIGHYIDSQINISDAAGDEGAIFAGVVQGKVFDAAELEALKAEDDTATVMLDGKATVIEQDNTLSAARIVTVGPTTSTSRDWVGTTDTNDYYKFTLSNTSSFNLTLNGLSADADVQLLNSSGSAIQSATNSGTTQDTISRSLSAGTYYVRVYPMSGVNTNYNLNLTATPVDNAGNTLTAARIVTVGPTTSTSRDWVGTTDTNDYYRFTLSNTSNFNLTLNGLSADADVQLLNSSGSAIQSATNSGTTQDTISRSLSAGTYYVRVYPMSGVNTNYNLSLTATPVDNAGNTLTAARIVTVGPTTSTSSDWVGTTDTNDYYRFTLSNTSNFNLTLNGLSADADVQLLNSSGSAIQSATNSGTTQDTISRSLSAGTYYVRVYPMSGVNTNYNLSLAATPVQTQIPTTDWKAEYFNNTNLTGSPVFVENLGSGSQNFSRNWGNGAPTNTPADNFSARMSTQRYLAPGLYKIQATADDGVRVRVNNQTVIDKWVDQPFVTNSGYFRSNGGNVPVTVDYYERGSAAAINFNITPATKFQDPVDVSRQWHATVHSWNSSQGSAPPTNFWEGDYNNPNAIGVINLGSNTRSDGKKGINADWNSGAPNGDGNRLPHDNFAMRAYTLADFDGSPYKFRVRGDDGFQLLAMNVDTRQWYNITPATQWSQAYGAHSEITHTLPAGRYAMHFHQYEGSGNAYLDLSWEKASNPEIDIRLDFFGNFTQAQKDLIEKGTQNWESIITKDMVPSGVLTIAVTQGSTTMNGGQWNHWAETDFPNVYPLGTIATPNIRHNLPTPYDNQRGIDYNAQMHFNSNQLPNLSNNWLVRLATHEIGHALYLDEAQYDSTLGMDGVMDKGGLDQRITEGIYRRLEYLGYGVDRNAPVYWS